MEAGGEDADWINNPRHDPVRPEMMNGRRGGMMHVEFEARAEKASHPQHMKNQKEHDHHRADALPQVKPVFCVRIFTDVWLASECDPDAVNRVVDNRQENEDP